jgi:hypothetical protein
MRKVEDKGCLYLLVWNAMDNILEIRKKSIGLWTSTRFIGIFACSFDYILKLYKKLYFKVFPVAIENI